MERLVTTAQAAQILGLSLQGIHYRIKKEQLKSIKKAGKIFVYINDDVEIKANNTIKKDSPNINTIIEIKNEQIKDLKKSMKWMKKQYVSEINRLEKNQDKLTEVFKSEIELLQSAFNEMKAIYKPQLTNNTKKSEFITLKDFFLFMKKHNKSEKEIKLLIFTAMKNNDKRFIYNKKDKKLLIKESDFSDLI